MKICVRLFWRKFQFGEVRDRLVEVNHFLMCELQILREMLINLVNKSIPTET